MGAMHFRRHIVFLVLFTLAVSVCDCNRRPTPVAIVSHERSVQLCKFGDIRGEQVSFYIQVATAHAA
ncbi:MAG TPA: hypothetical protein VMT82_11460 [candidate division Zixibacteria bacterium]|nr:hypothetical protein [candidate division Zixibacteria bacterium]